MRQQHHKHSGIRLKVLSLFYCSLLLLNVHAQEREPLDTVDSFKGNVFKVKIFADTVTILDPVTMEYETVIESPSPVPYKMNAMNIYRKDDVDKQPGITEQTLKHYVLHKLGKKITNLGNGTYRLVLNSVVISEQGKVVYYDYLGIEKQTTQKTEGDSNTFLREKWTLVPASEDKIFHVAVDDILTNAQKYPPAQAGGYPVPYRMSDEIIQEPFYIEDGKITHHK